MQRKYRLSGCLERKVIASVVLLECLNQILQTSSVVASEQAIRALQSALPPALSRDSSPMEIENVPPTFLLPPNNAGSVPSVLSGGGSSLGDRVAFLGCNGPAPLGARGTVVGVHDDDFEVLFDAPFLGGNDLQGRQVILTAHTAAKQQA